MRKRGENYNSMLIETLSIKPIAFNPLLAKLGKSATAGLFMSQLLYWYKKGWDPDWFYKTIKEIQEETTLTRSEQQTAIRIWTRLQVLTVKKYGVPPKRHFHINENSLADLIKSSPEYANCEKSTIQSAENDKLICEKQQYISESTPENTTDNSFTKNANDQF